MRWPSRLTTRRGLPSQRVPAGLLERLAAAFRGFDDAITLALDELAAVTHGLLCALAPLAGLLSQTAPRVFTGRGRIEQRDGGSGDGAEQKCDGERPAGIPIVRHVVLPIVCCHKRDHDAAGSSGLLSRRSRSRRAAARSNSRFAAASRISRSSAAICACSSAWVLNRSRSSVAFGMVR